MINLSQEVFNSSNSVLERLQILRMPDVFLAQDMRDYRENINNIIQLHYRKFYARGCVGERAFISVHNVAIEPYCVNGILKQNWFLVHDDTAEDLMYWFNNDSRTRQDLFPTKHSFEEIREESNKAVWVHEIFFRYLIGYDLGNIVEVNKSKPIIKKAPAKESLLEKIRGSISQTLEPQPAY